MEPAATTPVQPPTKATLARYGFGCGPASLWQGLPTTPEEDWLHMLLGQGGVCPVCGKVPSPAKSSGLVRFVIDHEHVRGWKKMPPEERRKYVRGLTCWFCNSSYLGRSINILKARGVLSYLTAYEVRRPPR